MKLRQLTWALLGLGAAFCVEAQTSNTPPTISGTPSTSVAAGTQYRFAPTARDANGDYLRFYIANKPAWATFSMTTGILSGTPTAAQVGSYPDISIYVSDSRISTFLPTFTLNVTKAGASPAPAPAPGVNNPPVISGSPRTSVTAGSAYSFQPTATDANGDYLRFYIANKPAWATFSMSTGLLSGTPTAAQTGTYSNISIYVSDSKVSTFLPTFSLNVTGGSATSTNRPPVISGTPPTSVVAGRPYAFQPGASDADGDALSFSVSGKPSWATFSVSKGSLTGTPTTAQVGSYSNIVITANDGKVSTSLPGFGITVSPATASGTATLSWTAPTQNTDGSPLTNLAGYRVYHGTSAGSLTQWAQVTANTTNYVCDGLTSGTHYFALTAYNSAGVESALSVVGSKNIP